MSTTFGRPMVSMRPGRMARRMRRPDHKAYVHFTPWTLQPFFYAPVLPGETLKNLLFQARVLSTPLANNQVSGWWVETYWFYVKHRHTAIGSTLMSMMLDMNASVTAAQSVTQSVPHHMVIGDFTLTRDAYRAVVDEYFRGDGETYATGAALTASLSFARLNLPGWWDSILPDAALTTSMGGIADDSIGGSNTALDQLGEVGKALEQWQALRMLGVTNLEYDDWLRSFGVSIAAPLEDRPELIRYTREWTYPATSVSVDATAQRVSSVVSWSLTERADKDRYFKEPGVILGLVCARPKLYHDRQQAGVNQLQSAMSWQTPFSVGLYDSYQPVVGMTGYQFDTADLFNHGDQYRFIERGTSIPTLAWPADGELDYPDSTLINALFVDGANGHLKMDASVSLQVATGAVSPDVSPATV